MSRPPVGFHALCWGQDVAICELLSEEFVLSCISQGWQEIQYVFTDGVVFRMSGQTTNSILSLSDFRILLDSYNIEFMEFIDLPIIENYVL